MNISNFLTVLRILLIFPVLFFSNNESSIFNWYALIIFVFAGLTDQLDGYIARKTGTSTKLGALLDLMADKLLICIILIWLLNSSVTLAFFIPAAIIISRELIISSLRQFFAEQKGFNPINVSFLAKSKTTFQITALSFLIISPNFGESFYTITFLLFWLAAYLSLHSFYNYVKSYKNLIK